MKRGLLALTPDLSHTLAKPIPKQPISMLTILNKLQQMLNKYKSVFVDYDSWKSQTI